MGWLTSKNEKKMGFCGLFVETLAECEWHAAATGLKSTCRAAPEKYNASARRLPPTAMPERWPQVFRVKITFESLLTICFVSTPRV